MKEDFIKNILIKNNIKVIIPEENDIITINNIIFNELCQGIFNKDSKKTLMNIINGFENECDGVILGCTELGLLIEQKDINIKLFDTTVIHAKKAAELALN